MMYVYLLLVVGSSTVSVDGGRQIQIRPTWHCLLDHGREEEVNARVQ